MPSSESSVALAEHRETLASVTPGDTVRVERLHFADVVRASCPGASFAAAELLRCVERSSREVVVATSGGRRVAVDRFYACFVEVTPLVRRA